MFGVSSEILNTERKADGTTNHIGEPGPLVTDVEGMATHKVYPEALLSGLLPLSRPPHSNISV